MLSIPQGAVRVTEKIKSLSGTAEIKEIGKRRGESENG